MPCSCGQRLYLSVFISLIKVICVQVSSLSNIDVRLSLFEARLARIFIQ